jgi:hypothetical protein
MKNALLPALTLLLVGCARESQYMRPSVAPVPTSAEAATVVFVRENDGRSDKDLPIVDDLGNFLGDLDSMSYFAVQVPPGRNGFVSWFGGLVGLDQFVDYVEGDLLPGRVYYVEVSLESVPSNTHLHLLAATPRDAARWSKLRPLLATTKHMEANPASDGARAKMVEKRRASWRKIIDHARWQFGSYHGADLEAHLLHPDDGEK